MYEPWSDKGPPWALIIDWLLFRGTERRRARLLLEERLRFEAPLAELSAELIHFAASDIDAALERALQSVGTHGRPREPLREASTV